MVRLELAFRFLMGRCWPLSAGVSEQGGEVVSLFLEVETIAAAMKCVVVMTFGNRKQTASQSPPSALYWQS